MEYSLYKLKFTTALHIGKDAGGSSLDNGQMNIHADTLFAALCCEGVRNGRVDQLVQYFKDGILAISDALPYADEELYLPKPVLYVESRKREGDTGIKKALKNIEYIPLSIFKAYIKNLTESTLNLDELNYSFGQLTTLTRVAIKGHTPPLPYHVASWRFTKGCGMYILVGAGNPEALNIFEGLLNNLGWSGIGGKQSSGWGKFEVQKNRVPDALQKMIADDQAAYQMLLGTALPIDEEMEEILPESWYTVIRRGGFVRSENYARGQLKKRTMYMLGPGSCVRKRFLGGMYDLSENGNHPVWRCGNSLFVGVNL